MLNSEEFTDSTDWLGTPLATLASVESSLRCQVCKDFYTTPMMTSCSHTFCSLCIRRYLSQEGKCPTCRESDQEIKLRRNWVVEELVEKFQAGRKGMLDFARTTIPKEEERPMKRRKVNHTQEPARRSTRSQSKKQTPQTSQHFDSSPKHVEIVDSDEGSEYEVRTDQKETEELHDGLVSCPICGRRMKETSINSHLDSCIGGGDSASSNIHNTSSPRRSNTPQLSTQPTAQPFSASSKSVPQRERLPTINYSMLNDNALRKKLRDLGISSTGSKEMMRRRHTEWVNLWNANCDARNPTSKADLLRELAQWERTLGRQIDRGVSGVMVKEFDREGWQQSNKGEFDDLIAKARAKAKQAAASKDTNGDDGNDNDQTSSQAGISSPPQLPVPNKDSRPDSRSSSSGNPSSSSAHRDTGTTKTTAAATTAANVDVDVDMDANTNASSTIADMPMISNSQSRGPIPNFSSSNNTSTTFTGHDPSIIPHSPLHK